MRNDTIFAIIINYCNPIDTIETVNSLFRSSVVPKIVVVDNASSDNSYKILKSYLPHDVVLIRAEQNNGFSSGNNIGIRYALFHNARYIILLNNDTSVDRYMICNLLKYTDQASVTSPKIYYYDCPDRIWFAGGRFERLTGRFIHIGYNKSDSLAYNKKISCDFLSGCCIMMTSDVVRKVGLLDESYFMYYEDVDYSIRLKKEKIDLFMIPEAKLWHKVGASSGGDLSKFNIYYGNRNRLFLLKKFRFFFLIRVCTFISRLILMLKGGIVGGNQRYIFYSLFDYFLGRMGKQERRH